jgi:F420-non-reducing hydrogenase small subunit
MESRPGSRVRVAWDMLAGCSGCEMALLDVEAFHDLMQAIDLVYMPFLQDDHSGNHSTGGIPEADVGILSGSIRTQEQIQLAQEFRNKCKVLVSLGTCAGYGGIPALANLYSDVNVTTTPSAKSGASTVTTAGSSLLPPMTERVMALGEVVHVDAMLPGCPPTSSSISSALQFLANGLLIELPSHSVCDDCPTVRLAKSASSPLRRPIEPVDKRPVEGASGMRCFLEQGFLCLGPVTRTGCGGDQRTPRCIAALLPCRGCSGPLRPESNPLVDLISALTSLGLDARTIEDRLATINRFAGLTGRRRPLRRGPVGGI